MALNFPPGGGDDFLQIGKDFIISLLGTNTVLTAEGHDAYFRSFNGSASQQWTCIQDAGHHFGLKSKLTGGLLSRNPSNNISVYNEPHGPNQRFQVFGHDDGGFQLAHLIDDTINFIVKGVTSNSLQYLKVAESSVADAGEQLGIHLTQDSSPPFRRFKWVTRDVLARSSAPYYKSKDSDQNMDATAIEFLVQQGIKGIISLNTRELDQSIVSELASKGIEYLWSAIDDYGAPTKERVKEKLHPFWKQHMPTLVYCGFGHGRTGTVISALQMIEGRVFQNISTDCWEINNVEAPVQFEFLEAFAEFLAAAAV